MTASLLQLPATVLSLFHSSWQLVLRTPAGWLFVASVAAVLIGMAVEVWCNGFELQFLKDKTLHQIEKERPHLPSFLTLAQIVLSNVQLFFIALFVYWWISPQPDARAWMLLAFLFAAVMVGAILLELRWRSVAEASCAFSTATTAAFLLLLVWGLSPLRHPLVAAILGTFLTADVACLGMLYNRCRRKTIPVVFLCTAILWSTTFLLALHP